MDPATFHPDFKARPFWWDAIRMGEDEPADLPAKADVVIIGGGLTGLNCAIELGRGGCAKAPCANNGLAARNCSTRRRLAM